LAQKLVMEVEEEPLLPLMRNRRSKTRSRPPRPPTLPPPPVKDKSPQVQANTVQSWGPSPEAARRLAKLRRRGDDTSHYYIIMAEVGVLLVCLVLLFLCVTHPKWFHYQVTRVYAYMGHAHAQHLMGEKLMAGRGVPQNNSQAMQWFRAAADQGHPHAQYNLAAAHLNGHDAGLDEGEEEELLEMAALRGVDEAHEALEHLCSTGQCRRGGLGREDPWDEDEE